MLVIAKHLVMLKLGSYSHFYYKVERAHVLAIFEDLLIESKVAMELMMLDEVFVSRLFNCITLLQCVLVRFRIGNLFLKWP